MNKAIDEKEGCLGHRVNYGTDGWEYECGYEFSGDINCEDCMFGPYPDENSLDPRVSREDEDNEQLRPL